MAPVKFIAVPVGTATGVEWRGVVARHGDQGYKIFWCASALAEMAAKAAAGGAIVYPSGLPKTPTDLCGEMGVEAAWAEEHLFPTLVRLGEGHADPETGAWVCTSPMFARTLEWQQGAGVKALPAPERGPGRPATGQAKTQAERAREYRLRKKNETSRVTEPVTASQDRHENRHGNYRDASAEDAEIVNVKERHENSLKEVKSKVIKKQQQGSVTGAAAASPAADPPEPQNLLPGEVEELLVGLPQACRAVAQKFPTLPQAALLAALEKIKRQLANIKDPPAYLFTLLSAPDAALATPESEGPRAETPKDKALKFYNSLPPEKQEKLLLLGKNTQGGSRDPIYTGWCAIDVDPALSAQFAI